MDSKSRSTRRNDQENQQVWPRKFLEFSDQTISSTTNSLVNHRVNPKVSINNFKCYIQGSDLFTNISATSAQEYARNFQITWPHSAKEEGYLKLGLSVLDS